ncbi:MAG: PQQ-dependent sugar dehydrogenase [Candidatus Berkelbacteria bacterium]|nr:MAG: PQQ-dependent sugar dehydrogenase [Candidatus Berkelbacteria bacterium]QQG51602.1 MAG: PQQ-dependent sugar dehydrogenase [Candidatus Berkelbacteria bacterium]
MKDVSIWWWNFAVLLLLLLGSQLTPSIQPTKQEATSNKSGPLYKEKQFTWETKVLLTGLDIPWDLAQLPDGGLLITERTGKLKLWDTKTVQTVAELPVATVSESGLTGIALHPKFPENHWLYLYYTYRTGGELKNKVVRYVFENNKLTENKTILDGLAGGQIHNGGRLRFGPDDLLYVLTGDAARPALAQDPKRLEGKILRLKDDGSVPDDNPTKGSLVYTLGHRNPQGLTWHSLTEEMYATEHGETANDELNAIQPGQNYGWPTAKRGALDHTGFVAPLLGSGDETWAPSGIDFVGLKIWELRYTAIFAGLRSQKLQKIEIIDGKIASQEVLIDKTYGRLRAVLAKGDGSVYVTTSNRDGRTNPQADDDRLLIVTPVEKN